MTATSIPLAALTETVARALSKYPAERGRIERAAQLVATGHVEYIALDLWAVRSQKADETYFVDNSGCPCVDAKRYPRQSCKHKWAIDLLLVATERARRLEERVTASEAAAAAGRAHLAKLIEQRQERGWIVAAEGGQAIEDERCRLLDEQIARLRVNLAPATFRELIAA